MSIESKKSGDAIEDSNGEKQVKRSTEKVSAPHQNVEGRILILGDSISDDGRFLSYLNTFFRLHGKQNDIQIFNVGVSSETISGLSEEEHPFPRPCIFGRLQRALDEIKPDWVISLYGINDAIYSPLTEENFDKFKTGYVKFASIVNSFGAQMIVLTPVPFDSHSYGGKLTSCQPFGFQAVYEKYEEVMCAYAEWIKQEMTPFVFKVVDLHGAIVAERKAIYSANTRAKTGDGIHPNEQGHFFMSQVLLKDIFGISLSEEDKSYLTKYKNICAVMQKRDRLTHRYFKEKVGHDNIYKDNALPIEELQKQTLKLNNCILRKCNKLEKNGKWKGFKSVNFVFEGYKAIVVFPKVKNETKKWIYRTEFFGAFPSTDIAMLGEGYHVIALAISNQFGSPSAVSIMKRFVDYVSQKYSLQKRGILFGFSRGGLYALNFAATYSDTVTVLYLDAPVVDIRSWPFGNGKGQGSPVDCDMCLSSFGISCASDYKKILDTTLDKLASVKMSLILVAGDSDEVVPYDENGALIEQLWQKTSAPLQVILKEGCHHHPHSLDNPQPIVDFLLKEDK